jgi:hypothetical protein
VDFHVLLEDWSNNSEYNTGRFVERIGFISNYPTVPHWCQNQILHYTFATFYCYHDSETLNAGGSTCSLSVGVEENAMSGQVEVTMFNSGIQVKHAKGSMVRVYDTLGKQLLEEHITGDNQFFDVGALSGGVLLVVVETGKQRVTKKVVSTGY